MPLIPTKSINFNAKTLVFLCALELMEEAGDSPVPAPAFTSLEGRAFTFDPSMIAFLRDLLGDRGDGLTDKHLQCMLQNFYSGLHPNELGDRLTKIAVHAQEALLHIAEDVGARDLHCAVNVSLLPRLSGMPKNGLFPD